MLDRSSKLDDSLMDAYRSIHEVHKGHAAGESDIEKQASQLASDIRYKAKGKIRDGMKIGAKVTLRNKRMYEFLDRLINLALPRVRDFRGLNPKSFDGNGNFSMGIKEQIIFHEIDYDKVDKVKGLDIIICTSAKTDEEALELLKSFNMPFPDKNN